MLRCALAEQGTEERGDGENSIGGLGRFLDYLEGTPLGELERRYVDVFDISRRHALYLSYWTDGDTRRRGEVLAGFKAAYRASGFLVDTGGSCLTICLWCWSSRQWRTRWQGSSYCGPTAPASSCCASR